MHAHNTVSQRPMLKSICSREVQTWTQVIHAPVNCQFNHTLPHGVEEIVKTIGHDDVVIDSDDEGENDHGDANPHSARQHFDPYGKGANLNQIRRKLATQISATII